MRELIENRLNRYRELQTQLAQPETLADVETYGRLTREYAELEELKAASDRLAAIEQHLEQARDLLDDPDLGEMAREELAALEGERAEAEHALRLLVLPKDPDEDRNVVLEIRAGTGGEEAALFAMDLLRMYQGLADRHGWRLEIISVAETDIGGAKELICSLSGRGAYGWLKFESGAHRVQRVPVTESGGRIHTSAVTVAVMPEAQEVEVHIEPNDLRIDVFRSSGHGGQSVNTTDSAVRVTHLPTGMVVSCQDEKSQLKNKEKALKVLRSRLLDLERSKRDADLSQDRRAKIGSGDRSERIRTYNFPQGRVTDHRVGLTLYKLDDFMAGDMDEILNALRLADQEERLRSSL